MENKEKDASTNRLQSLRLPRDLTLAVSKSNRRQFTPNFNVVRKHKSQAPKPKEDEEKKIKVSQERRERPNRNTRPNRFIQTEGIFSQGIGPTVQSSSQKRVSSSASTSRTSSTTTHRIRNVDAKIKLEHDVYSSESDSDEEDLVFAPRHVDGFIDTSKENPVELSDIKEESKERVPQPFCDPQYSNENPAMCLVSLPPGFRGTEYENAKDGDQIGKLQILKSGRMRMQIGDQWYDFEETDHNMVKQDALLINPLKSDGQPEAEQCYSVLELGDLLNTFTISVDYEDLLLNQ